MADDQTIFILYLDLSSWENDSLRSIAASKIKLISGRTKDF